MSLLDLDENSTVQLWNVLSAPPQTPQKTKSYFSKSHTRAVKDKSVFPSIVSKEEKVSWSEFIRINHSWRDLNH